MAPKENQKAVAAREKKAMHKAEVDAKKAQEAEAREAQDWSRGAKSNAKAEAEAARRAEQLAKKAEREALLKEEETTISVKPARPARGEEKKAAKKQGNIDSALNGLGSDGAEEFAATGIDSALDLMAALEVSPAASATAGNSNTIERHPERRMKSAYAAFEEEEMPKLKAENPTLRQSQLKQLLQKHWKKSPRNPLNQVSIAHNASADEERQFAESIRSAVLDSMKVSK